MLGAVIALMCELQAVHLVATTPTIDPLVTAVMASVLNRQASHCRVKISNMLRQKRHSHTGLHQTWRVVHLPDLVGMVRLDWRPAYLGDSFAPWRVPSNPLVDAVGRDLAPVAKHTG